MRYARRCLNWMAENEENEQSFVKKHSHTYKHHDVKLIYKTGPIRMFSKDFKWVICDEM